MFISVVIPMHNAEAYLDRGLQALLPSSYPRVEVIIVDDASTDRSAAKCREQHLEVLSLSGPVGTAAARNAGAQ